MKIMLIIAIRKFFRELSKPPIINNNSGKGESYNYFILKNKIVLKFVSTFMTFLLIFFGLFSIYNKNYLNGIIDLSAALIMILILLHMRKTQNYTYASRLMVLYFLVLTMYFFQFGKGGSGLYLWSLCSPIMLIFFLKIREGTIISIIYLSLNIFLNQLHIFPSVYSGRFLVRYSGVFITLALMSYIYGRIQERTMKGFESTNLTLKNTINKLSATKKGLQQSEERYRALVENSNDGIGILKNFNFIYVNNKLCEMSGYLKDELLKKPLTHILKSVSRELSNRIFDIKTLSGDLPKERIELHLKTKTGEIIEVEIRTNIIEYEDEKSQLISISDVRDRNLVEKERTKIANLESFRMVANGVTHDFNNILTIIMGNLELIKFNRKGNPKLDNPLKRIEEASSRATELLDDLYVFSTSAVKDESLENIMEIIGTVLEPLRREYIGAEFKQESDDELWKLRCDKKQICIAMKNILLNSLDATEGKAFIEVSVSKFLNKSRVVQSLQNKEFLKISIRDSGKGIPEENLGRIFDPYFSTKGNVTEKGIGLGLAIANKIILDHNGLIKVQSKIGSGTTFEIFLPAEIN